MPLQTTHRFVDQWRILSSVTMSYSLSRSASRQDGSLPEQLPFAAAAAGIGVLCVAAEGADAAAV